MEEFYQKFFWLGLSFIIGSFAVAYRLLKTEVKVEVLKQVKTELLKELEDDLESKINMIDTKLTKSIESLKRHEDNNSQLQIEFTKRLLKKFEKLDDINPKILSKMFLDIDEE